MSAKRPRAKDIMRVFHQRLLVKGLRPGVENVPNRIIITVVIILPGKGTRTRMRREDESPLPGKEPTK